MFLIDDLIGKAVDYFFTRVSESRDEHDQSIIAIRQAMRSMSSSFGEVIHLFRAAVHRLRRNLAEGDEEAFWDGFATLLDEGQLRQFCNESGVCEELRLAQDRLLSLPWGSESPQKQLIEDLAYQLEAYEIAFIRALQEYVAEAETIDLLAASRDRQADPGAALDSFQRCIDGLDSQKSAIDGLIEDLRQRSLRAVL